MSKLSLVGDSSGGGRVIVRGEGVANNRERLTCTASICDELRPAAAISSAVANWRPSGWRCMTLWKPSQNSSKVTCKGIGNDHSQCRHRAAAVAVAVDEEEEEEEEDDDDDATVVVVVHVCVSHALHAQDAVVWLFAA